MVDGFLKEITEKYGSPLYVYDGDMIEKQYSTLKDSFPDDFEIFFSVKTNPLLGICQLFKSLGSQIEVASSGELCVALEAGFSPGSIIFTSPGKTFEELEYAIESGIYSINIESVEEAEIIDGIAARKSRKVDISLRINPDFNISGASVKMSGVASQFGIDFMQLEEAFKVLKSLANINIIGIHIYTGTQVLNANDIVANMEEIIKLAINVSEKYSFDLKFLDLGGGFGVPYFKDETPLDTEGLKQGIAGVWDRYKDKLSNVRMGIESGRFLMAEAGVYLSKVIYRKESKGQKYIVCDGGSSQHAASAFLGRYIRNNFPMHILGKHDDKEEVNVVGPLCTPTDVVGYKAILGKAVPGDILSIDKSGAYGLTNSPAMFLSHILPAELICYKGEIHILREKGEKEDFLRGQKKLI